MRWNMIGYFLLVLSGPVAAQDEARQFDLAVAPQLADTGLLDYILPRFTLKTGRRATLVSAGADLALVAATDAGQPFLSRGGDSFSIVRSGNNAAADRFEDWLLSDVGTTTITSFTPPDGPPFVIVEPEPEMVVYEFPGDVSAGAELAALHCGRCHRTSPQGRNIGIGSTPSFMALRALADWQERFVVFFALNPHPAFLQVDGISPPFDPERPSPIVPVELTFEEVEAIQAYAASVQPADLGAPVQHQ